jgi:hypothetical protein
VHPSKASVNRPAAFRPFTTLIRASKISSTPLYHVIFPWTFFKARIAMFFTKPLGSRNCSIYSNAIQDLVSFIYGCDFP